MRKRKRKIRILCAGNGDEDYERQVYELVEEKNLEEYILLLGVREDVDVLMRKSRAFILPSKYEGMPLVMIEAQAAGLPCISAETYSPEVDFGVGLIDWLSLSDDVSIWVDAVEKAVTKERIEKKVVENAIIEKQFDSKMFAKRICDIYEEDYGIRD